MINLNSYNEFWEAVLSYCRENMNNIAFNMWIEPLQLIKVEPDRAIISAPGFKIELIMSKYKSLIEDAFFNVMGFNVEIELIQSENVPKVETKDELMEKQNKTYRVFDFIAMLIFAGLVAGIIIFTINLL